MSRIGKAPIMIPSGVTFENNYGQVTVTGKLGKLKRTIDNGLSTRIAGNLLFVENRNNRKELNAKHGLYRQLINNMIIGVSQGYEKKLNINGVGYKVTQNGLDLVLNIGFSHPIRVKAIDGITLSTDKNVISVKGINKELVGQFAARIRSLKPVEPYHAYGISYLDETILRKEVKSGKK